jgi:hypothetical protein
VEVKNSVNEKQGPVGSPKVMMVVSFCCEEGWNEEQRQGKASWPHTIINI